MKCDGAERLSAVYFCRVLRKTQSDHQPNVGGISGSRGRKQALVTEGAGEVLASGAQETTERRFSGTYC